MSQDLRNASRFGSMVMLLCFQDRRSAHRGALSLSRRSSQDNGQDTGGWARESFWKTWCRKVPNEEKCKNQFGMGKKERESAYMIEVLQGLGAYLFVTHEPLCLKLPFVSFRFFFNGSAVLFVGSYDGLL